MPILPENYNAKWGTRLAASGAVYLGAHIADPSANIDTANLAGTLEWLAMCGAGISTYSLAVGGLAKWQERIFRIRGEKALQSLPEFAACTDNVPAMVTELVKKYGIADDVAKVLKPIADADEVNHLAWIGQSEAERVRSVADTMTSNLVFLRPRLGDASAFAGFWSATIDTGLILDNVYPIQPGDTKTPETVPGERHWFDFAEHEAIQRLAAA